MIVKAENVIVDKDMLDHSTQKTTKWQKSWRPHLNKHYRAAAFQLFKELHEQG